MTAKIGSTANQVTISSGTQPVANLPASCGIAFCKNKLLNGEVTRINQRAFDGNWAPKGNYPPAGTIAQKEATYGYDQWAKADATNMLQVIEAGNFRPSTVHTLSGQNVTTQQITSPASGNWTITVPQTARNVQLEEGAEATPFEIRPIAFELAQCQRYYLNMEALVIAIGGTAGTGQPVTQSTYYFPVEMRVQPTANVVAASGINIGAASSSASKKAIRSTGIAVAAGYVYADFTHYWASAVL